MLKTKIWQKLKNNPLVIVFFCLLLIIGVSRFLLFLEANIQPTAEVEAAPLPKDIQTNQMTGIIEDGFIK